MAGLRQQSDLCTQNKDIGGSEPRNHQVETLPGGKITQGPCSVGEDWACVRDTQEGRGLEQTTPGRRVSRSGEGLGLLALCAGHHADLTIYSEERRAYGDILQSQKVTFGFEGSFQLPP